MKLTFYSIFLLVEGKAVAEKMTVPWFKKRLTTTLSTEAVTGGVI